MSVNGIEENDPADGHVDPRQGRICLFALHNVPALTELTYDYGTDYRTKLLGDEYRERLNRGSR